MDKNTSQVQILIPFAVFPACYQMTTDRISRELWWTSQDISSVDFIQPWLSMLIYHLGINNGPLWYPQFRDVVSPQQHDHHQQLHGTEPILRS
jgi:hypothetical protein